MKFIAELENVFRENASAELAAPIGSLHEKITSPF